MKIAAMAAVLAGLVLSVPARAGSRDQLSRHLNVSVGHPSIQPILWDIDRQQALIEVKHHAKPSAEAPRLLPHRIYLVYREAEKKWFWGVTDGAAAFADPPEFLRSLSVFPGAYLGASHPDRRYMLTPDGLWAQTGRPREEFYWVYPSGLVPESRVKIVEYETLAKGKR